MAGEGGLHPAVLAVKEHLARGREKLRKQHAFGSPGVQVCRAMSDLFDEVVLRLWEVAIAELGEAARTALASRVVAVAHSGYGRREMAPYSDLDVMLLHDFPTDLPVLQLSRPFSQLLYDTGIDIGYSVRPLESIGKVILSDGVIYTSLAESRFLAGSEARFRRFQAIMTATNRANTKRLFGLIEEARREERIKYGETVYLLQPNVKRSRGGLREIQFLRWIGYCVHGLRSPEELGEMGWLMQADVVRLREAREYLLQLRNELHFHAGRVNDTLERSEQLRIATEHPQPPIDGLHPVEIFMREYFQHTSDVRDVVAHFTENSRPRSLWQRIIEPLASHQMENDFLVGPGGVAVKRSKMAKVQGDVGEVLRLLDLANLHDKRIEQTTWESIRRAMSEHPPLDPARPLPPAVAKQFLLLMSQPGRLGQLLRSLHALRVLEQIIPGFRHARGLLQFNDYHKYTVDEHSLRAIEALTDLVSNHGPAGEVYRQIRSKRTVHLAALLHDLGKGYPEDHSEVGRQMAEEAAERLYLSEAEAETLVYLVHKHLLMSHVAQRLDITDDQVVAQFARDVGSLQNLQMLYVLTYADLAAVGPGVLNDWKLRLLTDLYNQTKRMLTSDSPDAGSQARLQLRRKALLKAAEQKEDQAWWQDQIQNLPVGCMFGRPLEEIVEELDRLRTLPHRQAVAWGRYLPERKAVEYTVGTYEEIAPGIFHRLTGALTSQRQRILSAEIHTLAGGMVLDRFYVDDPDYGDRPPADQIEKVSQVLLAALATDQEKPPVFRRTWQGREEVAAAAVQTMPTRVAFDNTSAANQTVLSIFAYDRMGLLYAITRRLFELRLSVRVAKIGTHLDQVVDVFYVVDEDGQKIEDNDRLEEIERQMIAAIDDCNAA